MTPVPMEFRRPIRGPMGFEGPLDFRGAYGSDTDKSVCGTSKTFFFWRSHQNPKKIVGFFSSFLKFTKLEMLNI